jgi:hypothetical protein
MPRPATTRPRTVRIAAQSKKAPCEALIRAGLCELFHTALLVFAAVTVWLFGYLSAGHAPLAAIERFASSDAKFHHRRLDSERFSPIPKTWRCFRGMLRLL